MMYVRPKKKLGQHFLIDKNIAEKIVNSLLATEVEKVIEIGPGTGVLTSFLIKRENLDVTYIEVDTESVAYLKREFPTIKEKIVEGDFLDVDLAKLLTKKTAIIGNFPYNISSQIFFKVLKFRENIPEVVCMIQKEVAERIATKPGSKKYGILSVLLQAFYDIEYLFTVNEQVFNPPPKVKSAVIRFTRNKRESLGCDEALFISLVKMAFNQRRKMLSNALGSLNFENKQDIKYMPMRAEQLSVDEFIELTNLVVVKENN
ncbi:MAG TPA: 16S rRNA (adenine(1518)-N(6)/adenine(1519)-N(6))-dimethyltransferase [Bacteroidales bacterium]|nr:MAG: 16S rRNA (adenine(1518)-N(6)/adenine(1519)-N(6))-dimethyltransferase [Bacteroidetes bacterium GWF2_33_38]OFY74537.1 MAG: 16S rRNA (adenine(1518)-N(6)/adenine(1519)-N(6))-dimethyltransferase [Bacteroidetes bacterium RIFOXYA12_FULL_33_9]OFY89399.1 MAG: 16S rRNA (adenine(1518)-N(6)/adenine(1519)-N(6))-dimethyltransferase [Bacteroidetes bacterium RIFOXYA2_FULL_33_7]HBF87963.1 16S rRNA (adenine(1518)-N(6)/adenine(1519)-N(6))-dimethyltransferase [Bacteroidales bacterium]